MTLRPAALSLAALSTASWAVAAAPASAQMEHAAPVCTAPAELPAWLQSWRSPVPVAAGTDRRQAVALVPGQAATVALSPAPKVRYPLEPAKPGGPASFGGLASFTVKAAGTWRVALGSPAWIDVVRDGTAAKSTGHAHGPDCTGVRKTVDFQLAPGTYTLQLAASSAPTITVLVAPFK